MRLLRQLFTALSMLALLAGCASGPGIQALDARVVNGIVQRPGGTGYYDFLWVRQQVEALAMPVVEECLSSQGRSDLAQHTERYLRPWIEAAPTAIIATERYRREGVNPPGTMEGLTDSELPDADLVRNCYFDRVAYSDDDSTAGRILQLQEDWIFELQTHFEQNPLLDEFAEFEQCLHQASGFPPQGVEPGVNPDLSAFLYWWPAQHGGDQTMSEEDNLEGGRLYADCLDPYTDAQAESTDELREEFLAEHYSELERINDELVG